VDKVVSERENLIEQIESFKINEQIKRDALQNQIKEQKEKIRQREVLLNQKEEKLSKVL
jgi:hypothetical protein